jgi:mannose/fructose/N-acetylgalactosamine-specific phosphotransferase system component IIC
MTGVVLVALLLWTVLVTVDLATFPQALLSRPIVAATVAGFLLGEPQVGITVGMVLELYALDVMPVGASRYPDYGAASVASVAAAAPTFSGVEPLVAAGLLGLPLAALGGMALHLHRRLNTAMVAAANAELAAGSSAVVVRLHWAGVGRDVIRGLVLGVIGLGLASLVARVDASTWPQQWLSAATLAGGVVGVLGGLVRTVRTPYRGGLLIAGLVIGIAIAVVAG